ncbi:MAG: 2,3,4,5-tetrahydropyridine-2,6-dicarboxylate N-succinyltransferase [Calditrichaeota bacterium]|nr:MAG: 2,3,4,5-tetrahydropyridine-2,6-dicarboxylate N-succinyltransferase [Calditrichota bacterium]
MFDLLELQKRIEEVYSRKEKIDNLNQTLQTFTEALDTGLIRAAEFQNGKWLANTWVKKGILLLFRYGHLIDFSVNETFRYFDKNTLPTKSLNLDNQVRVVPGGTSIRRGAYVAPGVIIMPPAYINIGAYVDEGALIDSHALVGSCAQVGKHVHLSAGAQLGGVLEPIGTLPVIVEDHVIVGGNCGVFEGTVVGHHAVLGAGVILTRSTPVYDCVKETIYRADTSNPLMIPPYAVVVPGTRPLNRSFAQKHGLAIQTPIIVKYRDANTDAATALEEALR